MAIVSMATAACLCRHACRRNERTRAPWRKQGLEPTPLPRSHYQAHPRSLPRSRRLERLDPRLLPSLDPLSRHVCSHSIMSSEVSNCPSGPALCTASDAFLKTCCESSMRSGLPQESCTRNAPADCMRKIAVFALSSIAAASSLPARDRRRVWRSPAAFAPRQTRPHRQFAAPTRPARPALSPGL